LKKEKKGVSCIRKTGVQNLEASHINKKKKQQESSGTQERVLPGPTQRGQGIDRKETQLQRGVKKKRREANVVESHPLLRI